MFPRVKAVKHVKDYDLEVTFTNGVRRIVPFREVVSGSGEMIKPLRNVNYFKKVRLAGDFGTLEWPNGYDICPDVLYWMATGEPITWATDPKYHSPPPHLAKRRSYRRGRKSAGGKLIRVKQK